MPLPCTAYFGKLVILFGSVLCHSKHRQVKVYLYSSHNPDPSVVATTSVHKELEADN